MDILVLGNGFDIAHNLPTQYSDFLDFLKSFAVDEESIYTGVIQIWQETKKPLYKEICEHLKHNQLVDYFLSIYSKRCAEGKRGWIDFEKEISFIVQEMDRARLYVAERSYSQNQYVETPRNLFQNIEPLLFLNEEGKYVIPSAVSLPYFDNLASRLLSELNQLIRLLEIYLYEYVENLPNNVQYKCLKTKKIDRVLSFNYTDTYSKLYESKRPVEYCYVHGKASGNSCINRCNLVLGIDEYIKDERKNNDNQFVWFKKFYQRIYKQTGSEYCDWIDEIEKAASKKFDDVFNHHLYIVGHSLDVTDKDILSKLILMNNTRTFIFYHSPEAMSKQISNLIRLIGEDELILRTGGSKRKIVFRPVSALLH